MLPSSGQDPGDTAKNVVPSTVSHTSAADASDGAISNAKVRGIKPRSGLNILGTTCGEFAASGNCKLEGEQTMQSALRSRVHGTACLKYTAASDRG